MASRTSGSKKQRVRGVSGQKARRLPRGTGALARKILNRERVLKAPIRKGFAPAGPSDRTFLDFQRDFLGVVLPGGKVQERRLKRPEQARALASRFSSSTLRKYQAGLDQSEADRFAKRTTARAASRVKFVAQDRRAMAVGRRKDGSEIQRVLNLELVINSDALRADFSKDDLESRNTNLTSVSNVVNQFARRQLVESLVKRGRMPAYVHFFLYGITPGTPQVPRKLTSISSFKYPRFDLQASPEKRESLRFYFERVMVLGMEYLNTEMLKTFAESPGPFFTVLKVATEVAFDSEPSKRQEFDFLVRQNRTKNLHRISRGTRRLRELAKDLGVSPEKAGLKRLGRQKR